MGWGTNKRSAEAVSAGATRHEVGGSGVGRGKGRRWLHRRTVKRPIARQSQAQKRVSPGYRSIRGSMVLAFVSPHSDPKTSTLRSEDRIHLIVRTASTAIR